MAIKNGKSWTYLYKTKNKKVREYEVSLNDDFDSDYWFYVSPNGQIMNSETFHKIAQKMKKNGLVRIYPFGSEVLYYGEKWGYIKK